MGFELFKFILTFYIHACLHMIYVKLSVTAYKFIIRKTGSYLTSRDIKFHIEYIYRYSRTGIGLNCTEMHTVTLGQMQLRFYTSYVYWMVPTLRPIRFITLRRTHIYLSSHHHHYRHPMMRKYSFQFLKV